MKTSVMEMDPDTDQLFARNYGEFLHRARTILSRWNAPVHTSSSSLVHEVYARMQSQQSWRARLADERHFVSMVVTAMRHTLLDHYRRSRAAKRHRPYEDLNLDQLPAASQDPRIPEILESLEDLAVRQHLAAQAFELQYLGGFQVDEIAALLDRSLASVKRDLQFARAFIRSRI